MSHDGGQPWTTTELREASALWRKGWSMAELAIALGRSRESIKHQVASRRDLFPRRRDARSEIRSDGDPVNLKVSLTPFLHRTIKAEAARRGVSQNMLIREALRDRFLRRKS